MHSYVSTRDPSGRLFSFEEALLLGYAPDGGVFVPAPSSPLNTAPFPASQLCLWASKLRSGVLRYNTLAFAVMRKFVHASEIPDEDLQEICDSAVESLLDWNGRPLHSGVTKTATSSNNSSKIFEQGQQGKEKSKTDVASDRPSSTTVTSEGQKMNVVPVRRADAGLFVAELFHGPTFCFKDIGQQWSIRFLSYFANRKGTRKMAIVSTTGDTGPAALRAVADVARACGI
ncbi:unnamed protein product [Amoebophrya sp. A25]|nr:unnamed protein product [Amoebophrya sp. A25]|eukprot:GSA25T00018709001.1